MRSRPQSEHVCADVGINMTVRHSYASALLRSGQSVKVVSQRIGQASPTITMTIYQHVLPSDDAEAARLGGALILGPNGAED